MYLSFYGLSEKPFSITPDPRYLYLAGLHAEALAHLVYGIDEAGGFIQLTGEVGTGKTTIIRSLLARAPKNAEIALILNPRMNAPEFMLTICEELGIMVPDEAEGSVKDLIDILNRYLLRVHSEGRRVVLIVDEAQNLAPELMEQVRLLTNLETETQKLLQIILIGQPELREVLARNDLRQLAQRITGRYHLDPLSRAEALGYVKHRLRIAGATADIFSNAALNEVYRVSGGVPRLINIISDRALLGGYSEDRHRITAPMVRRAASEVFGHRVIPGWIPWLAGATCIALLVGGAMLSWRLLHTPGPASAPPAVATVTAPVAPPAAIVVAPPPAPTPVPTLTDLLHTNAANTDMDSAWWRLFGLWKARYVTGSEDACTQALRQGLECQMQRGTLAQLRSINRPAILDLIDSGALHHVVLAHLEGSRRAVAGRCLQTVAVEDLLRLWQGEFIVAVEATGVRYTSLSLGMRGANVRALRGRLQRWQGRIRTRRAASTTTSRCSRWCGSFSRRTALG